MSNPFNCFKGVLSAKNKGRNREYTRVAFGCGDIVLNTSNVYCPPKTREETANTRTVYSGLGIRGEKLLSSLFTKNKR